MRLSIHAHRTETIIRGTDKTNPPHETAGRPALTRLRKKDHMQIYFPIEPVYLYLSQLMVKNQHFYMVIVHVEEECYIEGL